jgi:hypothetical protein
MNVVKQSADKFYWRSSYNNNNNNNNNNYYYYCTSIKTAFVHLLPTVQVKPQTINYFRVTGGEVAVLFLRLAQCFV